MSKKTWVAIAALVALAVALAIGLPLLLPPAPGVTYANFSRLEYGMTRDGVEALLGKPNFKHHGHIDLHFGIGMPLGPEWSHWKSDTEDIVSISFAGDRIASMTWNGNEDDRTGMAKLRDRLPWLARRPPARIVIETN
jgi:outer membrane protein assembly factor BamE (lipoprotein component of BamABCDE complex)